MNREYHKWFSPYLQRDMELLIFGHTGKPILFFPTRTARFYDYENWGVINAIRDKINSGDFQVFCVDSADKDSFYNKEILPAERIKRHYKFEKYILSEVIPFISKKNQHPYKISAGCSLGAFHAVNLAFRHPHHFKKVIGMSGRYDLTLQLEYFQDLFEGYWDQEIYLNTPIHYIQSIRSPQVIRALQKLEIQLAIGLEDAFLENNQLISKSLSEKHIQHTLDYWEGEAHKARNWGEMLQKYL